MIADGRYLAAKTVSDVWICYPWEATYVFLATFPSPHTQPPECPSLDPVTSFVSCSDSSHIIQGYRGARQAGRVSDGQLLLKKPILVAPN